MSLGRAAPLLPSSIEEVWAAIGDGGPRPSAFASEEAKKAWVEAEFAYIADVLEAWVAKLALRDGVRYVLDVSGVLGTQHGEPIGFAYKSQLAELAVTGQQASVTGGGPAVVYWSVYDPMTYRFIEVMLLHQVRRAIVAPQESEATPADAGLAGGDVTGPLYETA